MPKSNRIIILGAGITGLSVGEKANYEFYEAQGMAGGICSSYYVTPNGKKSYGRRDEESYRFETGGGHWIFGANENILHFINSLSPAKRYIRNSAVYFSDKKLYVPYPLQNHLSYLGNKLSGKVLKETALNINLNEAPPTLIDWLSLNFGKTLCELFFFPFHQLYTAGLYKKIAPQDQYKTPIDRNLMITGSFKKTPAIGYNATFLYPEKGLNNLIQIMAERVRPQYNKRVVKINTGKKEIYFADGKGAGYKYVISTIPLNKMLEIAGIQPNTLPDPYISVLVINIGAKRGKKCPDYHWLYIPGSKSGFHRIGFYSNVDVSFLPFSSRKDNNRVGVYVEKSFLAGNAPSAGEITGLCGDVVNELKDWGFIEDVEVLDSTWIEVAYTWKYPNSCWREKALKILEKKGIYQIGRYGKWEFQGIADSIKDGFDINEKVGRL